MKQRKRRPSLCTLALMRAASGEQSLRSLQPEAAPGQGGTVSPSAGNSLDSWGKESGLSLQGNLEGIPLHPLHNTVTVKRLMRIVFKNSSFNTTSHLHGFYCVLSSCTH